MQLVASFAGFVFSIQSISGVRVTDYKKTKGRGRYFRRTRLGFILHHQTYTARSTSWGNNCLCKLVLLYGPMGRRLRLLPVLSLVNWPSSWPEVPTYSDPIHFLFLNTRFTAFLVLCFPSNSGEQQHIKFCSSSIIPSVSLQHFFISPANRQSSYPCKIYSALSSMPRLDAARHTCMRLHICALPPMVYLFGTILTGHPFIGWHLISGNLWETHEYLSVILAFAEHLITPWSGTDSERASDSGHTSMSALLNILLY